VALQGRSIGLLESLEYDPVQKKAKAILRISKKVQLYEGDFFVVEDKPGDLMGSRQIKILRSDSVHNLIPANLGTHFSGTSEGGIADHIKNAQTLVELLTEYRKLVEDMATPHIEGKKTFYEYFHGTTKVLSDLVLRMHSLIIPYEALMEQMIEMGGALSASLKTFSSALNSGAGVWMDRIERAEAGLEPLIADVQKLIIILDRLTHTLQSQEKFLGRQIYDPALYENLMNLTNRLKLVLESGVKKGLINGDLF